LQALKRHYEKIILGIFLLLLLLLSVWTLKSIRAGARMRPPDTSGPPAVGLTDAEFQALAALSSPTLEWKSPERAARGSLFYPGTYMWCANPEHSFWLPQEFQKCPVCEAEQGPDDFEDPPPDPEKDADGDGIPNVVEEKYEFLNPANSRDADLDEDQDWFTNREEIDAETHPASAESHPPLANNLRLVSIAQERFEIMFQTLTVGRDDDPPEKWDITLQVTERGRVKSRFVKLGSDPVLGWKLVEIQRKFQAFFDKSVNKELKRDVSELIIENAAGERMTLVRNRPTPKGMTVRFLLYVDAIDLRKARQFSVRIDEPLVLTDVQGSEERYAIRVVDASEVRVRPWDDPDADEHRVTRRLERKRTDVRRSMLGPEGEGMFPGAMPLEFPAGTGWPGAIPPPPANMR